MQKIAPFLCFDDGKAEEAMHHYVSIFRNSRVNGVTRAGAGGPMPAGSVLTASFTLDGLEFTALNGGLEFQFNTATSFTVACDDQAEVDHYWAKLTADGGAPGQCGWLKDKYGLSWQITPTVLIKMMSDQDPQKAGRVMAAMMQMTKIDIAALERAFNAR